MGRLTFGKLSEAWLGEARDFTPLLAEQLDMLGDAIGVSLAQVGEVEVSSAGGRRIDIIANGADGGDFVIENQYGRADHDHLTRGLAYAVARRARGLVVVAEEHRDEFRAVAQYLNELAELDAERGIPVWLVEAKAVRIGDSRWAPLFTAVVEPNSFTSSVEQEIQQDPGDKEAAFWAAVHDPGTRTAVRAVLDGWKRRGHRRRFESTHLVLEAAGPSTGGFRTVLVLYADGKVMVPFSSYGGQNTGREIPALVTDEFRAAADTLFGFAPGQKHARNDPGWLQPSRVDAVLEFAERVSREYATLLSVGQLSVDAAAEPGWVESLPAGHVDEDSR
jgi:hypothetical protein